MPPAPEGQCVCAYVLAQDEHLSSRILVSDYQVDRYYGESTCESSKCLVPLMTAMHFTREGVGYTGLLNKEMDGCFGLETSLLSSSFRE